MSSLACRICLRTNVPTQDLPDQLKAFHEELCYLETVQHKRLRYCVVCAHQMKKFYKFKGQCLSANGLLKLWVKQKNKDISEYRKELPSPSIQITNNSTSFLFECQHGDESVHNTNVVKDCKRNLLLKLNKSDAPNDTTPDSSELALKSKPIIHDRPNPDKRPVSLGSVIKPALTPNIGLRPVFRPNIGLRPVFRPNIGVRPVFRPNIGLRPVFRPNISLRPTFTPNSVLKTDFRPNLGVASDLTPRLKHVKAQNGILTIDPTLITSRPNLILEPALRPNLIIRPNPARGLSIMLQPSGHKQPKPADLTFDPDFDVSYETDDLSGVKEERQMDIVENNMEIVKNTVNIVENTVDIVPKKDIEKQNVYIDDNSTDINEDVASEVEIDQKEVDEYIDRTLHNVEKLHDNDSMDDKEDELINRVNESDNEDELINRVNESDKDIDSDEYEYEYLEQDVELLDFVKSKRKEPKVTNIEENKAKETTAREPKIVVLNIETVPNKYNPQPAQNATIIPPEIVKTNTDLKCNYITSKNNNISKVKLNPQHSKLSPGFKAVPSFKEKMFGLLDENTFVLDDEKVLTKELFSVMYDKINVRELQRLAMIILEEDVLLKLSAYLRVLYRKYNPDYESIFHVEYLHTEEKKIEEFKRRALHPDYIRAAYKCELCYKTYYEQKSVDRHKRLSHDPANPLVCSICSYSVPTQERLLQHRTLKHQAAYSCKLCPLRTNLVVVMRNHYSSHKGVQYECTLCHGVYYNKTTFEKHKRNAHAAHVCTTCALSYVTERGLLVHRHTHHKDVSPPHPSQAVPCVPCGITFDTQQSYQRHCFYAHTYHDQSFTRRRRRAPPTKPITPNLHRTKKGTNRIKYRTCEICNEKVDVGRFSGFLYKHFKEKHPGVPYSTHPRDHLCDVCGKSFFAKSTLIDHKNCHTGARPYACSLCPATFHTKGRLWTHRGRHSAERRYRCEDCGKHFMNSSHLYTHRKIHVGDRCYKCPICEKGFLLNGALQEHVRGVHYKQRRVKKPKKRAQETSAVTDSDDI